MILASVFGLVALIALERVLTVEKRALFLPQAKMTWTGFLGLIRAGKFLRMVLVPSLPVTMRRVRVSGSRPSC